MADITDIIDYYQRLLIIQYHDLPKAQATIDLIVSELWAGGVLLDVRNGYELDTAVGHQLDILGKYIGTDRFYTNHDPINYFALTSYTEVDPDSEDKWGFVTYDNFYTADQYNGTLNYNSIVSDTNALSDVDFRIILHLKILKNNINHSYKQIDDSIFSIFGNDIRPSSTGGMKMYYFITTNLSAIVTAALEKGLLPHPIGVGITLIQNAAKPFFGFARYAQVSLTDTSWGDSTLVEWSDGTLIASQGVVVSNPSPNVRGFTTYAAYDTNGGEFLIYDQLS